MSGGKLCVIHIPRHILLEAVAGIVPATYETIIFAQWSDDKDSMMVGFAEGPADVEYLTPPEQLN